MHDFPCHVESLVSKASREKQKKMDFVSKPSSPASKIKTLIFVVPFTKNKKRNLVFPLLLKIRQAQSPAECIQGTKPNVKLK